MNMTDNQFNLLIGVLAAGFGVIGAAIRFSVNRVVKALDTNSAAMLENTKSNAVLSTKIDAIAGYVQGQRRRVSTEVKEFVKDFVEEEISGVHEIDPRIAAMDEDDTPPAKPAKSSSATKRKGTIG